jgi:16S rRNA (cytidine1402-2'-O)-methyltransferase
MPDPTGNQSGVLYVIATPIGNLEDITLRALRILGEVNLIAAEHVPVARVLLRHYEIETMVVPYHDRGPEAQRLIQRMQHGQSIALVSDAGTPGVSDPGRQLVAAAVEAEIRVVPIPGAASSVALWSVSGAQSPRVQLYGFLPRKSSERRRALQEIANHDNGTVVFESPRRVQQTLLDLSEVIPDAQLVIGRELTKLHEQIWRGSPAEALKEFETPRGEFTLLIIPPAGEQRRWTDAEIANSLADAAAEGASRPQAARSVAQQSGRPRREVYALWPFNSEH